MKKQLTFKRRLPIKRVAFAILTLLGCQAENTNQFVVQGKILHANGKKIMLAKLPFGATHREIIDSIQLDTTGTFTLSSPTQTEGFYQLLLEKGPGIIIINDTKAISIYADADSIQNCSIEGSSASRSIMTMYNGLLPLMENISVQKQNVKQLSSNLIASSKNDSLLFAAYLQLENAKKTVEKFLTQQIIGQSNANAAFYSLGISQSQIPQATWIALFNQTIKKFPQHTGLQLMAHTIGNKKATENAIPRLDSTAIDSIQ